MEFERTTDVELIKSIATHAKIYPASSDDYSPKPEDWSPVEHDSIWYVVVRDGGELLGMFAFIPENAICWRIHVLLLPAAYGERSSRAGKGVTRWIFQNTPCLRLVGSIPIYNALALRFASLSGWKEFGVNQKSHMKKGFLYDQILFGISRSDIPWD